MRAIQRLSLLLLYVSLFIPRSAQAAPELPQTFAGYGYQDRTASTMFGALEYYFPIPENVILEEGATLDLIVSHSPLLRSNRSTMTVVVNDVAVYSTFLTKDNQDRTTISIPLSVADFQNTNKRREGYVVLIQFFMRLTDVVCEETNNPALWATIYGDSTLNIQTAPRPNPNDLSALPYPFIVKNNVEPNRVNFNLPQNPSADELTAAANVAAYLGMNSPQDLPDLQSDSASATVAIKSDGREASLSLSESNGQALLSLTGDAPLASEALLHPDLFNQLQGEAVNVRRKADVSLDAETWAWQRDAATFAQLGATDRTVRGVGEQSLFLNFTRPAGWMMSPDSAYLDLHLTRSPLLLAEQSGVKVKINGMDMGAVGYYETPGKEGFYRFNLPADLLNVGIDGQYTNQLVVELIVEHQLKQQNCEPIYAENAWTTVHADSYFYFPHEQADLPDLSVFPYPFTDPQQENKIQIVLPATPTEDEIAAMLMIAQILGKNSFGIAPEFHVNNADAVTEITANAILIGSSQRNAWVSQAEEKLPQAWRGLIQAAVTQDAVGNLKEMKSPWKSGKWLLIVAGEADLKQTAAALGARLPSASIIAVRKAGSLEPLYRSVSAPKISAPATETRAMWLPKPETWQVILGVFVITVLAIFAAIAIYRRRK